MLVLVYSPYGLHPAKLRARDSALVAEYRIIQLDVQGPPAKMLVVALRLKIQCPQGRVGSTPTFGTSYDLTFSDERRRLQIVLLDRDTLDLGSCAKSVGVRVPGRGCLFRAPIFEQH